MISSPIIYRSVPFYRCLASLTLLALVSGANAQVVMDSSCNLTDDMYVLTFDNAHQNANERMAMATLRGIYAERGFTPHHFGMDIWSYMENHHDYHFNQEKKSRIAVLIDTYQQNISLMMTSDHKEDDMTWSTDNMAFIDGKTNPYADFRCSGDWIQLKWNGRDLHNSSEHFDSSQGFLSARQESFINGANQPDYRLRVARLDLHYDRNGLSGFLSDQYSSLIKKKTPRPHEFHYQANTPAVQPMIMSGKYRPGYENLSQFRLNFDAERLVEMEDESSAQNPLSANMPVSLTTARAYLHYVKNLMVNHTSAYMRSMYSVQGLHSLIDEADRSLQQSMDSSGKQKHTLLHNASRQLNELASRRRQINELAKNSAHDQVDRMIPQQKADSLSKQVDQILEHIAKKLEQETQYTENMKAYQAQQVEADGTLIDRDELLILEPDLFNELPSDSSRRTTGRLTTHVENTSDDNSQHCLMHGQEGIFDYPIIDRHYGFDTGIQVSLLGGDQWLVSLKSTRTPWTLPFIQTNGSDYSISASDTWCRGRFFGVDHARDHIRLTMRGVYDPVNNSMYVVSLWSVWDKSRVMGMVQGLLSAVAMPGIALAGATMIPHVPVPVALMFVASSTAAMIGLTPTAPPETRWPHVRSGTRLMAEYGMGDLFYTGNGRMNYYSSFGTLKPKGNID